MAPRSYFCVPFNILNKNNKDGHYFSRQSLAISACVQHYESSMCCVAKDLGLSAQNRHEIGRNLQEDGKLHLFLLHICINLLNLNITLEVYNTDNYVENLLQSECSVSMKIERWQLPFCCIIVVFTSVAIFSAQNERDACVCAVRIF